MIGKNPQELTIKEAIELYLRRNRPNWKGETERTYRKDLEDFVDYAVSIDIEKVGKLSRWEIGGFTDYLLDQDYARITVAGRQKTVRTWLKYLESQGVIEIGLHLAIDTIRITDEEERSDEQLSSTDAHALLTFYRQSAAYRGTRQHALFEVLWHTSCRSCDIRALDLDDFENGVLKFRNRPNTGPRLKRGSDHERNVELADRVCDILRLYIARERIDKRDDSGREPLFSTRQGRPVRSTIRGWMNEATQRCMAAECPHGKRRPNCEWVPRNHASKCPSTRPPHAIRTGSITWKLNLGFDIDEVASEAGTTPRVIRRYYDVPDFDEELNRRSDKMGELDIAKHLHSEDLE